MATRRAWTSWRTQQASRKPPGRRNVKTADPPKTWRIVRGDKVQVINGPEAGQVGKVLRVIRERGTVLVDGVRAKQRVLPPDEQNPSGRVVSYETPVHVSSVLLVDPSDGEPTKIRMGKDSDGKPVRISKRTGTPIPKPRYSDLDEGRRAAELRKEYEDKPCDTSAAAAARVTYRPSALSFEEEVIASLRGIEIDWSRAFEVAEDPRS